MKITSVIRGAEGRKQGRPENHISGGGNRQIHSIRGVVFLKFFRPGFYDSAGFITFAPQFFKTKV
jgi:hypothetical protein